MTTFKQMAHEAIGRANTVWLPFAANITQLDCLLCGKPVFIFGTRDCACPGDSQVHEETEVTICCGPANGYYQCGGYVRPS